MKESPLEHEAAKAPHRESPPSRFSSSYRQIWVNGQSDAISVGMNYHRQMEAYLSLAPRVYDVKTSEVKFTGDDLVDSFIYSFQVANYLEEMRQPSWYHKFSNWLRKKFPSGPIYLF